MATDIADYTQAVNVTGGSVSITGTATVTISGTPSVNIANVPAVTVNSGIVSIGNTPSVVISGTPTVILGGGVASIGSISAIGSTVTVAGTINIGNTPAVTISGTPTVTISSGSVTIANASIAVINAAGVNLNAQHYVAKQLATYSIAAGATDTRTLVVDSGASAIRIVSNAVAAGQIKGVLVKGVASANYYLAIGTAFGVAGQPLTQSEFTVAYDSFVDSSVSIGLATAGGPTTIWVEELFSQSAINVQGNPDFPLPVVIVGTASDLVGTTLPPPLYLAPNQRMLAVDTGNIANGVSATLIAAVAGQAIRLFSIHVDLLAAGQWWRLRGGAAGANTLAYFISASEQMDCFGVLIEAAGGGNALVITNETGVAARAVISMVYSQG
jgi:hypothetical protein